jgi:hypothetical protein
MKVCLVKDRGRKLQSTEGLVNAIIEGGLRSGAATIHIRHAARKLLRVSFGVDGQLRHILEFPAAQYLQIRNTILSEDDGTHTRNSQETRTQFDSQDDAWQDILKGHTINLRVHFSDTSEGESIHLVVSSSMSANLGLMHLVFEVSNAKSWGAIPRSIAGSLAALTAKRKLDCAELRRALCLMAFSNTCSIRPEHTTVEVEIVQKKILLTQKDFQKKGTVTVRSINGTLHIWRDENIISKEGCEA